jgi:hypothetical protein
MRARVPELEQRNRKAARQRCKGDEQMIHPSISCVHRGRESKGWWRQMRGKGFDSSFVLNNHHVVELCVVSEL